ncbi:MAG: hypothetical protein OEX21_01240 [Betaproteobacteria bacterium]|nr:hypothetical protein [Betaproteobacteria bacterium]
MKPRAFAAFLLGALLSGVPAVLSSYWVWTVYREPSRARDWAIWAAERSPIRLTVTPESLAGDLVGPNGLILAGVVAAFLCLAPLKLLFDLQRGRRASDETDDRRARLELTSHPARVGRPLEGILRLAKEARMGDMFTVGLTCERRYQSGGKTATERPFAEQKDVRVVPDPRGWRVPFRFDVPAWAPPSGLPGPDGHYLWWLSLAPAGKLFATRSNIMVGLGPAPMDELRALEAAEDPGQKETIEAVGRLVSLVNGPLLPHQRRQLATLSPEDRRIAGVVAQKVGGIGKSLLLLAGLAFLVMVVVPLAAVVIAVLMGR